MNIVNVVNVVNPQIFITAILAFCIAAAGWGILLYRIGIKNRKLIRIAILMLPFSILVNFFVKSPLNKLVVSTFDIGTGFSMDQPIWYVIFLAFLPPITEELIKAIPSVLPQIRSLIKSDGLWVGAWSGLGFGLGEILYLAWGVSLAEQYEGLPWYAFTGFLGERVTVCLVHALLTAIFFNFIRQGKGWQGFGFVVLLHLGVNAGAILLSLGIIQPWLTSMSLAIMIVILALIFEKYRKQWENDNQGDEKTKEIVYYQRNQTKNKG